MRTIKEIRVDNVPVTILEDGGLYWPAKVTGLLMKRIEIRSVSVSFTAAGLRSIGKSYKTVKEAEDNAWKILKTNF